MQSSDESIVPLTINCGLLGMNLMSTLSMRRHQCSTKCSNLCPSALTHPESYRCAIKEENYDACRAIIPVLQAEEAERFVKECRKYLDGEARIMKEVPGWKLGQSVDSYGRWMPPATGELHPDIWFVKEWWKSVDEEARIMKDSPALKVDQSVGPYVCSPFAIAAFSPIQSGRSIFATPRVPASVGASFAAFSSIDVGGSGRGLFVPAPVGARCYSQETGTNYNHIEQQRIYRAKKGQEPVLSTLAQVNGRLEVGEAVQIIYNAEKISLLGVDLPKEDDIMGTIYLAGGLVFRASKVVMEQGM